MSELSFAEKIRSISFLSRGQTKNKIREYRDPADGHRIKEIKDTAGNIVTEHDNSKDQVDVNIVNPPTILIGRK